MVVQNIKINSTKKILFFHANFPGCICECEKFCKGQGSGQGEGECKRITMSIFRTGKIIITGAREMNQIEAAYCFLNKVFEKHHKAILYQPNQ